MKVGMNWMVRRISARLLVLPSALPCSLQVVLKQLPIVMYAIIMSSILNLTLMILLKLSSEVLWNGCSCLKPNTSIVQQSRVRKTRWSQLLSQPIRKFKRDSDQLQQSHITLTTCVMCLRCSKEFQNLILVPFLKRIISLNSGLMSACESSKIV